MPIVSALGESTVQDASAVGASKPSSCLPQFTQVWPWAQGCRPQDAWRAWALETAGWLQSQQVDVRAAWIVLPVGAVLSSARQAWAQAVGGWLPRIDTIAGLVDTLGWAFVPPPWSGPLAEAFAGPLTLDSVLDRLQARRSLGAQAWARQWARRDPRGFDFALDQVVDAAQTWLRALQSCPPGQRPERVSAWRDALPGAMGASPQGPGHREALLLAWALEWAAASAQQGFASDVVFASVQTGGPAAWVAVNAGDTVAPGSEGALTLAALTHAAAQGVPVRRVVAQAVPGEGASVSVLSCGDTLDEARQAAATVLLAVNAARQRGAAQPVALIALDRGVVRHVRALLEDVGVSLADETGWRLSTTRAASVCSRLLAAANPRASTDELLDWLKSGWLTWGREGDGAFLTDAVGHLEAWCRRHGLVSAWGLGASMGAGLAEGAHSGVARALSPEGAEAWRWAQSAVAPLQAVWQDRRAHLSDWLAGLHAGLAACGAKQSLLDDAAGQLAWSALRLDEFLPGVAVALPWLEAASGSRPAAGAEREPPRRMVAIETTMGLLPEYFFPRGEGKEWVASDYLQALEPWRDRLLRLPAFLSDEAHPSAEDLADGFDLTGFFLRWHVLEPRGLAFADARRFQLGVQVAGLVHHAGHKHICQQRDQPAAAAGKAARWAARRFALVRRPGQPHAVSPGASDDARALAGAAAG